MSLVIGRDDLSKLDRELYKYGRHLCTSSVVRDKKPWRLCISMRFKMITKDRYGPIYPLYNATVLQKFPVKELKKPIHLKQEPIPWMKYADTVPLVSYLIALIQFHFHGIQKGGKCQSVQKGTIQAFCHNTYYTVLYVWSMLCLTLIRGVAGKLFKSRHTMIEERNLGVIRGWRNPRHSVLYF